jgi:hypothetical protein
MNTTATQVTILNITDGSVEVHRKGCADIAKKVRAGVVDHKWNEAATSKYATWMDYNADFLDEQEDAPADETTNSYDLRWVACCTDLVTDGPVIPRTMGQYRETQAMLREKLAPVAPVAEAPERTYTFADFDL